MNLQRIKNFDTGGVFKTFENTHKQFEQIFQEFKAVDLSKIKNINKIIVCGMGGSALGPHFVRSVFGNKINVPVIISNEYNLPAFVDKKTLIVISSFSGTTEESISCFKKAKKLKLKTFVICTGGELSKVDSEKFVYNPKYNYAKNPRFALGYSIASFICLLKYLSFLNYSLKDIEKEIRIFVKGKNLSDKIARCIINKSGVIIASEHLIGNAHIFQNQLNETGKNFASYFAIPEICHHQFEGFSFPKDLNHNIVYILIKSQIYHKRNQKRYEIVKEVLKKKKIKFVEINTCGKSFFEQGIYVLGLSSYISFYVAYFNNIDPQPNPYVDYLKSKMKN